MSFCRTTIYRKSWVNILFKALFKLGDKVRIKNRLDSPKAYTEITSKTHIARIAQVIMKNNKYVYHLDSRFKINVGEMAEEADIDIIKDIPQEVIQLVTCTYLRKSLNSVKSNQYF